MWTGEVLGEITAGAISGAAGILFTHPIDVAKVRIQSSSGPYSGGSLSSVFSGTLRAEGAAGLYKGLVPPLCGVAAYQAVCFGSFESASRSLELSDAFGGDAGSTRRVVAAGMAAGAATTLVTTPVDLCKIRMQLDRRSGLRETTVDCVRRIVRTSGAGGLYHGLTACLVRDVASTGLYFYVYEECKFFFRDVFGGGGNGSAGAAEMLAGGFAGSAAWGSIIWADNIKTRIQEVLPPAAGSGGSPSYAKSVHGMYREGGFRSFFRECVLFSPSPFVCVCAVCVPSRKIHAVVARIAKSWGPKT